MSVHYVPAKRPPTPDIMGAMLEAKVAPEQIELESIQTNGGTQMRAGLNAETVSEYMQTLRDSDQAWPFPPVTVYYDGENYWLGDGFHRVAAARQIGRTGNIPAEIRAGTRRDAVLYAAGANANHGLRRTNADKRQAVMTLLRDPEWAAWSDSEIARRCAVSQPFVGSIRKEIESTYNGYKSPTRVGADGRVQNVSNIGANQPVYAPVWKLESEVRDVYAAFYDADDQRHACSDMRAAAKLAVGGFWNRCTAAIAATPDITAWRVSDLRQAINNVAAQMEAQANGTNYPAGDPHSHKSAEWHASRDAGTLPRISTADIASREAAADEAERQAQAEIGAELNDDALLTAMQRYWSDHNLRAFASSTDPETACRRYIVQSPFGAVYESFRIESFRGYVSIWLKAAGDYWHRKADFTYTYSRWAKLTISLLPQLLPAPADADPWYVALSVTGRFQERTEALARAIKPWIAAYRDSRGRTWREIENPSHSNGQFWIDFNVEGSRRNAGFQLGTNGVVAKNAIDLAIQWLRAETATASQPAATALADLPVVATTATDTGPTGWTDPAPEHELDSYDKESPTVAAKRMNKLHTLKMRFTETIDLLEDFGELTGRHTATLAVGRELANLIDILEAEMDGLQKGINNHT